MDRARSGSPGASPTTVLKIWVQDGIPSTPAAGSWGSLATRARLRWADDRQCLEVCERETLRVLWAVPPGNVTRASDSSRYFALTSTTGVRLGIAFHTKEESVDFLNTLMGKGEPCTIVKEHRPPSQRKHRELELKAGDQVVVVARDKEWWWGIKVRDPALGVTSAVFGWFPAEHGALDSPTTAARRRRSTSSSLPPSTESDDVSLGDESGKLCCVCYEGAKDALFFPCRHIACCMECATALTTKSSSSHCPICRAAIRQVERGL
ncbi:zinc finger, C3HC4 type (RING finger) domain containing protein [Acanthamoeba castellanii str. Neff]|uniref:Zinc finger, C3HC4 type (RING finger) domain containing protein n=1 Tax=Acanthamoeba castellanii (strain ATCC 30010 / Neff) TaxID=1257118 RepID=L8HII3_ACACF|nr:zinc finger, C3HC4 type (RING finger) domain containing protein [Acanthamoeba castellanii str. Neff]ELR24503.1 zinc finger, C3HC4 type (RING finger) domain containing protein [Acanthamoeba castellanii str. Neff]